MHKHRRHLLGYKADACVLVAKSGNIVSVAKVIDDMSLQLTKSPMQTY